MARLPEFIANHPFLVAAAFALIAMIVAYEVKRATRGFRDVEPAEATRLVNHDDAVFVDVRPVADFDKGRLINAVHVPAAEVPDRLDMLRKRGDKPLIVYCTNGLASARVAQTLVKAGFARVYNLKGGLTAWEGAGLPVLRGRGGGRK